MKAPRAVHGPHPLAAWGLWLAVAGAPLVYSNAFIARFTLPKLAVLSLGVLLSLIGFALSKGPLRSPVPAPVGWALFGSFAALGLSAAASQDRLLSLLGRYDSYAYGFWPLALCAAVLLACAALPERRREQTLRVCLSTGALIALFAILEGLGMGLLPGIGALPAGRRAVSTLGSPVDLGAYLATLLPLALREALDGKSRPLGWGFLLAVSGGLLATASRGAWLGGAAGCAVFLLLAGRLKRLQAPALAAGGLLLAAALGLSALKLSSRSTSASDAQRPLILRAAWQSFLQHPWLGTGPDTFEQEFRRRRSEEYIRLMGSHRFQANAHNALFQALSTTGAVGTAALLALLAALFRAAPVGAALAGGLSGLLLALMFNLASLEVLVTAAALAGLLCPIDEKDQRPAAPRVLLLLAVLLAALSAAGALRFAQADRLMKSGKQKAAAGSAEPAAQLYRKGISLNPCELSYHILFVNQLSERVNAAPTLPLRTELLAEGAALPSLACHPNDVNARYIRGIALYLQAQLGRPELLPEAAKALDAALELDPHFAPLLQSRLEVAKRLDARTSPDPRP